jgi:hyperosmotically inducible periplasmic protein
MGTDNSASFHFRLSIFRRVAALIPALAVALALSACSSAPPKSPDVSSDIRNSLQQAGIKNVSVSQDRDKGVVTLSGNVAADADKAQAQSIAQSIAGSQVVSNQIAVVPPGPNDVKTMNSDLDKGIEKNLDAALIQNNLHKDVKFDVKSGVVTLTGDVNSQTKRDHAAQVASAVPNVLQVVNELQVKDQKATSTP